MEGRICFGNKLQSLYTMQVEFVPEGTSQRVWPEGAERPPLSTCSEMVGRIGCQAKSKFCLHKKSLSLTGVSAWVGVEAGIEQNSFKGPECKNKV